MTHPPEKTWLNPKIEIRQSPIGGDGIFANSDIQKGENLVIWGGDYTNQLGAQKAKSEGRLVMQWDQNLFSVEDRGDDEGYFINHSCNPNMWMKDAITLGAMRDIRAGEELTADYAMWEADENHLSTWNCTCGSKICRKKVTGNDWKLPELQICYKGHFSPLINKWIKSNKF